ncbi:peptidoglycan recognition protein family protein, partial [Microtetraspora fusca]|uniref:peptidoglycan recognition protein family protein n=1 Tax=Microtetraspora fusca TaxID=1997 RepID=UPI00278C7B43
ASAGSAGMTGAGTAVADGITGAGATGVGMRGAAPIARLTVGTALPLAPRIHTRQEGRAQPPRRRAQVVHHGPDRIVVHHTATANVSDTGLDAAFRLSQAIQRYHMSRNGWDDIGQQFTVSRGGYVMEGRNGTLTAIARGEHVIGAHTANHNDHTLGIETEGTYMRELPPHRQIVALTRLAAWLCGVYGLDPTVAIIGHRDLNPTSCPGDSLYAYLPELRRRVVRRMAQFQDPTQAAALAARAAQAAPPVPFERRPPRRLALPGRGDFLGSGVPFEHGPALGRHDLTD